MTAADEAGRTEPGGEVRSRLASVRERMAQAAGRAGRDPGAVRLVAVTKGVPPEIVAEVMREGVADLGESRGQELREKAAHLPGGVKWHFVGRIQRNKVAPLAPLVYLWHSVDRIEVGRRIGRHRPGSGVLVEVNVAGDDRKAGCPPGETGRLVDTLLTLDLKVVGLMTVAPLRESSRPSFRALQAIASRLGLPEVSMGMSGDFEEAIEEGATLVRIGRAIFGRCP